MSASPETPAYWKKGCAHLSRVDATLAKLIKTHKGPALESRGDAFYSLLRAIVGQQISVKAAESVWNKFSAVLGDDVRPAVVAAATDDALRGAGLSRSKAVYVKELAAFFSTRTDIRWHEKHDEEVVTDLISIKGIGRWSAEMFLIFHLLRPDVLPLGDLGLRNAMCDLYAAGEKLTPAELLALAEPWRPYRTIATWYFWRSKDPVFVGY